jgi:hypothetical protein
MNSIVFMQWPGRNSAGPEERQGQLISSAFSSIVGTGRNLSGFCRGPVSAAAEAGGKLF